MNDAATEEGSVALKNQVTESERKNLDQAEGLLSEKYLKKKAEALK